MQFPTKVASASALLACAAVLAGCGSDDSTDSGSSWGGDGAGATITMSGNAFDPDSATAKVGDEVSFENEDGYDHNVRSTSGDSKIDIDDFESGSRSAKLDKAGTVDFECTLHEGMTGSIEVEEA